MRHSEPCAELVSVLIQNLRNELNQEILEEILGSDPKIVDRDPEINSG